jgi:hypothetical protein
MTAVGQREIYEKELHKLYLPSIIRVLKIKVDEIGKHAARMEEMKYSYKCVVRKPEGMRPFRGPKPRW